jgi:DNA-binding MarR family transcriptional regulator
MMTDAAGVWCIVRHLTMSSLKLRTVFARDDSGRLFDPAVRASIRRIGGDQHRSREAISALRLAAKRLHDAMERWTESYGLTESRLQILTLLFVNPDHQLPLGELAEAQNLVPRTVTGLIDKLERDGLVRRVPDQADRRSVLAQLTKAGLARMEAMKRDAFKRQAEGTGGLNPEQLAELRHLCLLLVQNLNETEGEG